MQLYKALAKRVAAWRDENYRHDDYPALAEILEWASDPDVPNFRLRKPQLGALGTYWYLRLRENTPQIGDWRSMVDSVMIDTAYDGEVFNITLADVPERKTDLVEGKYMVETKKGATIAVKVTDMLGEEVLVVKAV
jgi:hypothetical protein